MKVAPRMHTREVSEDEADRMLRSGSWVKVTTAEPTMRGIKRQQRWRRYAENRQKKGYKVLQLWVPGEVAAEFNAMRLPGETKAALLIRLLQAHRPDMSKSQPHTRTDTDQRDGDQRANDADDEDTAK